MLSICNVGARQAGSYYQKDGYYLRMTDDDQRWYGKLKDDLELPDRVEKADFDRLIYEHEERAGFDLCFSAPKSVSIAMCLDDGTKQDMLQAHNAAVASVLEQIEANDIGTRITLNKQTEHVKTGKMLCGRFNHYVSRAHDPQLHTHCVILNKTEYQGKFYAVDNPELYRNQIINGQLYRNALAANLMNLGYEITVSNHEKGFFELTGITKESIGHFSNRRKEIEAKLKDWNTDGAAAAEQAALLTRNAKIQKDLHLLQQSWQETIVAMGGVALKKTAPIISGQGQLQADFARTVNRMTRKQFAFTEQNFKRVALAYGVGSGMTATQFQELFEGEIGNNLICLGQRQDGPDRQVYYCTRKNYETEQAIFAEVARSKANLELETVSLTKAQEYLAQHAVDAEGKLKLSGQQRDAVLFIATNQDQFIAIQGLAGTGKTYMLDYARQLLEEDGFVVKGACFTGKAAEGLQADAHITSLTLHGFLNQLEKEAGHLDLTADFKNKAGWNLQGLKPGKGKEVWVVDEAGMVDNVAMRHLVEAAKLKNAKVCLVGDRQQLLPVGVGNAFSNLVAKQKIASITLDEIRRQKDAPELLASVKEAVLGDVAKSLAILESEKAIRNIAQRKERFAAIVNEFTSLNKEQRNGTVILTVGNKDRMALNKKVRYQLKQQGELEEGCRFSVRNAEGTTYQREFAVGEKVIFLQNDQKVGVQNGQTGVVEQVNGDSLTVRCGEKEVRRLNVNVAEYNYIDYGYVISTHKAQGITVDRAIINLDTAQKNLNSRNSYYVDLSRARFEVKLFTDNTELLRGQVKDFAHKLTADDFLLPTISKNWAETKGITNIKQYCQDFFENLNSSIQQFRSHLKTLDMSSLPGIEKWLCKWERSQRPEVTKKGPHINF